MTPLRVAVVNDLFLARAMLRRVVESVPGYLVAWEAVDGADAVAKAAADRPDAILMDMVMPVMDGAEATRRIMARTPCPILIVTSSVGANLKKVYEALGGGGLDAVQTPTFGPGGTVMGAEPLLARLAAIGSTARVLPTPTISPPPPSSLSERPGVPLLAIGASTGGPDAIARVLIGLGPNPPSPVVIVQHIGADFARGLADWLMARTGMSVRLPAAGERPTAGSAYIVGGDDHLVVGHDCRFGYTRDPADYPYRPSANVFFDSLTSGWPDGGVAVLLTGMGNDGARGLLGLRRRGWHTIAQNQETSVVYGMPKAAIELGAAVEVLPVDQIGLACRLKLTAIRRLR